MKLKEIAHSRTGDKGNISVISVIAYDPADYALLEEKITTERVASWFGELVHGEVTRYEIPSIAALNFELKAAPVSYTHLDVYKRQLMSRTEGRLPVAESSGWKMV